jgi:hypothetical protein
MTLSIINGSAVMLSVAKKPIMLSVANKPIMLSVIMLYVVMLSVVMPPKVTKRNLKYWFGIHKTAN